jgi:hypothetical protein
VYIEEIQEDATAEWESEENKPQIGASKVRNATSVGNYTVQNGRVSVVNVIIWYGVVADVCVYDTLLY